MVKYLLIVSVFSFHTIFAQNSSITALKKLNEAWVNSFRTRDSSTLSKILDKDFILIGSNGLKESKRDNLLNLVDTTITFTSIQVDSVQVKLLTPDVGIVNCWTTFSFYSAGKLLVGKNCYQDVYRQKNKRWQAVAAHVTLLSIK